MRSFAVLALAAAAVAAPHQIRQAGGEEASRAAAVKEAFDFAWDGYYKYGNGRERLGGWAMLMRIQIRLSE